MLSKNAKEVVSIMCGHPIEKVSDLAPIEMELICEGYSVRVRDLVLNQSN